MYKMNTIYKAVTLTFLILYKNTQTYTLVSKLGCFLLFLFLTKMKAFVLNFWKKLKTLVLKKCSNKKACNCIVAKSQGFTLRLKVSGPVSRPTQGCQLSQGFLLKLHKSQGFSRISQDILTLLFFFLYRII